MYISEFMSIYIINVYIFSSPVRLHHNLRGSLPSGAALCSPQQLGGDQVDDRDSDGYNDDIKLMMIMKSIIFMESKI